MQLIGRNCSEKHDDILKDIQLFPQLYTQEAGGSWVLFLSSACAHDHLSIYVCSLSCRVLINMSQPPKSSGPRSKVRHMALPQICLACVTCRFRSCSAASRCRQINNDDDSTVGCQSIKDVKHQIRLNSCLGSVRCFECKPI